MAVLTGEASIGHGEAARAAGRVAGHGLIDHDRIQEGGVAVALGVVGCQITVVKSDGIQSLDTDAFGQVGRQLRIRNSDICCGVDRRRAESVGGVAAAVHDHGASATVCSNSCRRLAGGLDGQIVSISNTTARGHDAAGTVAGRGDHCVIDIQRRSVAVRSVLSAVAAVAEHAVGAGCI